MAMAASTSPRFSAVSKRTARSAISEGWSGPRSWTCEPAGVGVGRINCAAGGTGVGGRGAVGWAGDSAGLVGSIVGTTAVGATGAVGRGVDGAIAGTAVGVDSTAGATPQPAAANPTTNTLRAS